MEYTLEDKLTLEMIPEGMYKMIAEEIGIENLLKLADMIGGTNTYILFWSSKIVTLVYKFYATLAA